MSEQQLSTAGSSDESAAGRSECEDALEQVYAFLDHELDDSRAATIRQHLAACEPCVDTYDLELIVKSLIRRSCGGELAPAELRSKIMISLTTVRRQL